MMVGRAYGALARSLLVLGVLAGRPERMRPLPALRYTVPIASLGPSKSASCVGKPGRESGNRKLQAVARTQDRFGFQHDVEMC